MKNRQRYRLVDASALFNLASRNVPLLMAGAHTESAQILPEEGVT